MTNLLPHDIKDQDQESSSIENHDETVEGAIRGSYKKYGLLQWILLQISY
jgi:hypothetical protein